MFVYLFNLGNNMSCCVTFFAFIICLITITNHFNYSCTGIILFYWNSNRKTVNSYNQLKVKQKFFYIVLRFFKCVNVESVLLDFFYIKMKFDLCFNYQWLSIFFVHILYTNIFKHISNFSELWDSNKIVACLTVRMIILLLSIT